MNESVKNGEPAVAAPQSGAEESPAPTPPAAQRRPAARAAARREQASSENGAKAAASPTRGKLPPVPAAARRLGALARKLVYAQLGVYGLAYDGLNARWTAARRTFDELVARGAETQALLERTGSQLRDRMQAFCLVPLQRLRKGSGEAA
ncbi:MAG: hypothetical protein KatS3mg124_0892 [Porticoccaceae bacterium]|nr:MAG: hypothetical protein KatS3mg124_0892 [Porticoccaceae bacterium]